MKSTSYFALALLTVMLVCPMPVRSQILTTDGTKVPTVEASVGYISVPAIHTNPAYQESFVYPERSRQGWYVSANIPFHDVVGVEGEMNGTYGKFTQSSKHVYSNQYLGGLRFSERDWSRHVVPYFNVLTGAAYRPYLLSHTGTTWIASIGLGMDVYATKHVGLKLGAAYTRPVTSDLFRQYEEGRFVAGISFR
jgi:hypothetical protein